ncbi:Myo-inositol-1(Or 4)-monophosphatase [Ceratobasidium sp. AG-Ba]|nr:Myo-inositol-1(Or 4)-monophosphatase [Ceratobasidium sp. AG-Ba]
MAAAYALEKHVAIAAVSRACGLTASVFKKLVNTETVIKGDESPVTVADISAQATINTILGSAFPDDPIIGEEDTSDLRLDTEPSRLLRERIVQLANDALRTYTGGAKGRMWTLDPIDGTKGFLRGEQYAVCLALIVDSVVQVGVMGCPNLPLEGHSASGERGCLFVAVRGQGAEQRPLSAPFSSTTKISIPPLAPGAAPHLLESVESGHSSHTFSARFPKLLGSPHRLYEWIVKQNIAN